MENYIKFDALRNTTTQLEQSIEGEYESVSFCLQHDQMVDIFGELYASNPSEFKFERGDKIRIRNLVEYVKDVVDGDGKLKGLQFFEMKCKTKSKSSLMSLQNKRTLKIQVDTKAKKNICELKSELHRRIVDVLTLHDIDTNGLDDDMVEVEPNGVFGLVHCISCKRNSKKQVQPKRVYYKSRGQSGYWVVANFDSHIKRVHKSSPIESTGIKGKKLSKARKIKSICKTKSDPTLDDGDIELSTIQTNLNNVGTHDTNNPLPDDTKFNESNTQIETIEIDSEADMSALNETNNTEGEVSYDKQISTQITKMMSAVLMNGDVQTQMDFQLKNDHVRYLSAVDMNPNGDCLLSALCHQRFRNRANSKQHINDTNRLRAEIVAHILKPENFSLYQYHLQDRVYELKTKSEITDMEAECKDYVRNVLSKRGEWGGMEVLKAASNILQCNILTYNEHGECSFIRHEEKKYNQILIIAYRYMTNAKGESRLCHYNSVSDLDPDSILATANRLPKY